MLKNRPFKELLAVLACAVILGACDSGGVGTSSNQDLSVSDGRFFYTGQAARDTDVLNFQFYLWSKVIDDTRCGGCHNSQASSPVNPLFFDTSDINVAYDSAIGVDINGNPYIDKTSPLASVFVTKVSGGHNCWESVPSVCGTLIAEWIDDWNNAASGGIDERPINLVAPTSIRPPGAAKSFPASATTGAPASFADTVYPLLVGTNPVVDNSNCQNCHEEIAMPLPQAPFFASGDIDSAYEAAKAKMDIDTPSNSRFVQRLNELHNCWTDCTPDAALMEARITAFANGISATSIDPDLVTSAALTLGEGIIASGGSRYELNQFALWEFKTGSGLTAFDTSGVEPAVNLTLIGSVNWVGGYGLELTGGRAQADTMNSDKLFAYIQTTNQYAIEAWVIPANVSQQDANIVSYSGGDTLRNFTLGQTLYNYESFNQIDTTPASLNGTPMLTTGDSGNEIAQASLQHVVVNYDPAAGRTIFVNGQQVMLTDPAAGESINNVWDDTFAFILGNETSGQRPWAGQVKMVALHNQTLSQPQIQQNFDVGVGQKFFLLFSVGEHLGEMGNPMSFIMFEVAQFDSYSYLFNNPTFVNLDPNFAPGSIDIEGMRIGINGKEAIVGQAYANKTFNVNAGSYGVAPNLPQQQVLSSLGTIIPLEKGPDSDEFFLTFENFNGVTNAFVDIDPTVPGDPADPGSAVESDIGMRTFEEINTTIADITGVPVTNSEIVDIYKGVNGVGGYIQQLPSTEAIDAFLPSHQMAIAQLALTSCSELVEDNGNISRSAYFPGFNFTDPEGTAFNSPTKRDQIIQPLLTAAMNVDIDTYIDVNNPGDNLTTQPDQDEISNLLGSTSQQDLDPALTGDAYDSLITQLLNGPCVAPECVANSASRTRQIVKAVCAVATGGAVMLAQ
jgi:hypothetical protein